MWPVLFFVLMVVSAVVGFWDGAESVAMWTGTVCFVVNGIMFFVTTALARLERKRKTTAVVDSYEDVIVRCLNSGNVVIGNKRDDGKWDVREVPDEQ